MDANDNLIQIRGFVAGADGPGRLRDRSRPRGDVFYVAITAGQVRRIRYTGATGGNTHPIAAVPATPLTGIAPLTGRVLERRLARSRWRSAHVRVGVRRRHRLVGGEPRAHATRLSGIYTAQLTVTDGRGGSDIKYVG